MHEIAKVFNETFAPWQIALPPEALETRERGKIQSSGWTIQYRFDQDERGAYLDYYAAHRMTNDRHMRIYEDGAVEQLEAPLEFMVLPPDCTEEEKKRIEADYFAENRRIYAEIARKGFRSP